MESSCVEILHTKRGNSCIVVDNYQLRRYREKEEIITWVCVKEKKEKCKGRVKTTKEFKVVSKTPHTCVPNKAEIEIKKKMERCKKRVREDVSVPVHKIFQEEMTEIHTRGCDFLFETPSYKNAKTSLCRQRRAILRTTQNPTNNMDVLFKKDKDDSDDSDMKTYKEMMQRDKRRWETADKNKDNQLSKEEFTDFLHPEEASHMHDVVIMETLEDIDKDNDGKISLKEYIGDMYSGSEEDEPDWVKNEREQFSTYRDKNKDGIMDKEEVKEWILPSDYNDSEAEAKHLIYESDENKDGKLSKEEILNSYDLFVGSQATDFGGALNRHDEF